LSDLLYKYAQFDVEHTEIYMSKYTYALIWMKYDVKTELQKGFSCTSDKEGGTVSNIISHYVCYI